MKEEKPGWMKTPQDTPMTLSGNKSRVEKEGQPFQAARSAWADQRALVPQDRQPGKAAPLFYRRRLPHWQPDDRVFFLTWRLVGSLPREAVERLRCEREFLKKQPARQGESPRDRALRIGKALFAWTDQSLAEAIRSGSGPRWLGEIRIARLVQSAVHYLDGVRYNLHRYVIMPNHIHLLVEPLRVGQSFQAAQDSESNQDAEDEQQDLQVVQNGQAGKPAPLEESEVQYVSLRTITQGLKGYTAREANRLLGRRGAFWQDEGFDHWMRDEDRYLRCVEYIDRNPVEAGLCGSAEAWPWGSAGEVGQPFQAAQDAQVAQKGGRDSAGCAG
jgi:REP element-mobilizing transposase RayT